MLKDKTAEAAARLLLSHRDRQRKIDVTQPEQRLVDIDKAYAIQAEVERILTQERKQSTIGYKLAATNAASREHLRVAGPFIGRLYAFSTVISSAIVPESRGLYKVYEPEIALRLAEDIDPAKAPFDAAAIEAATAAVLPAMELIGTYFSPWTEAGAASLIADNAAHGFWIKGAEITDWSGLNLLTTPITLEVNGKIVADGKGENVDDGAFGAAAWLANLLASRGLGLKAGEYITTGSVTTPYPVDSDQRAVADFGDLGQVSLKVQ